MKPPRLFAASVAAAFAAVSVPAQAYDIINTGPATLTSDPLTDQFVEDNDEVYAFGFSIANAYSLSQVSGYFRAISNTGANIEFSIANNIGGQPGTDLFGCSAAATTNRTSYGCALAGTILQGEYFLKIGADAAAAIVVEGDGSVPSYVNTFNGSGYTRSNSPANLILSAEPASIAAAPEPATWGLMLVGFGLAGAALRRRGVARPALRAA